MKVIVAGMPKTGTKSTTAALRKLGYSVYDFTEHMYCLENDWDKVFRDGFTTEMFYKMYKDVDAAVDMPASFFWEEIYRAFPDAKIILTVRDSEEAWFKSLKHHWHTMDSHLLIRVAQFIEILLQRKAGLLLSTSWKALGVERTVWGRKSHLNDSILKMKYRAHNAHVMHSVPQDKLLLFNCKQGWKPFCKFLEAPIPDGPFPHENVNAAIVDDTLTKHPLSAAYKKELIVAFVKLIGKFIFVCVTLGYIVSFLI